MRLLRAPIPTTPTDQAVAQQGPAIERLEPLFGQAQRSQDSAPATSLDLTLHGSFVNADPSRSSAILQRGGESAKRFVVGGKIDDSTRLHAVYRDRIELERNGRIERLSFPVTSKSNSADRTGYSPPPPPVTLDDLQEGDEDLLQQRMEELRQQMEASMLEASPPIDTPEDD
jgi:general secretion pathway protein C